MFFMCALIGILCVWWAAPRALSLGGACRAIRDAMSSGVIAWVVAVVFAEVVPRVRGMDDYPNAAAKAACDVWAEAQTTNTNWQAGYKWGCAKYISSGGTLTSCKVECASKYSSDLVS